MNPEIKAKWVAALRSGEYKQGKRYLKSGDTYCCLGVLCDIAAQEGLGEWTKPVDDGYKGREGFVTLKDCKYSVLPIDIIIWANLTGDGNPEIKRHTLTNRNDYMNEDFNKIADVIEKYL